GENSLTCCNAIFTWSSAGAAPLYEAIETATGAQADPHSKDRGWTSASLIGRLGQALSGYQPLQFRCHSRAHASLQIRHRGPCMGLFESSRVTHFFHRRVRSRQASSLTASSTMQDDHQRGPRFRARLNRATTLYAVGPRTGTTMQSCASAAKLRSGGPILPIGMKAKGLVGKPPPRTVIGISSQTYERRRTCRGTPNALPSLCPP